MSAPKEWCDQCQEWHGAENPYCIGGESSFVPAPGSAMVELLEDFDTCKKAKEYAKRNGRDVLEVAAEFECMKIAAQLSDLRAYLPNAELSDSRPL